MILKHYLILNLLIFDCIFVNWIIAFYCNFIDFIDLLPFYRESYDFSLWKYVQTMVAKPKHVLKEIRCWFYFI